MKQTEKDEKLRALNERQMQLMATMCESDAHAAKCVKLGLTFATEYPGEAKAYEAAREEYNTNEAKIADLQATEVEPEDMAGALNE